MTEPKDIEIGLTDDGSEVQIVVGEAEIILSASDADALYRKLIIACAIANRRQREAGILPTSSSVGEEIRQAVGAIRCGARPNAVLLELLVPNTSIDRPEIRSFVLDPGLAEDLQRALGQNVDAARQLRSPS